VLQYIVRGQEIQIKEKQKIKDRRVINLMKKQNAIEMRHASMHSKPHVTHMSPSRWGRDSR